MSEYTDKIMKIFLSREWHNSDYCIVCEHNVRKDIEYYDINGATVCVSCMHTNTKIINKTQNNEIKAIHGKEQEG